MERTPPLKIRCASILAAVGIRAWMRTLNYRALLADPQIDTILPTEQPRIYVFWHEYILLPLYLRGHCNLSMLLSKHRDADILDCLARQMGFQCVRGSTYNGGATALRELARRGQTMHLTITPDGPRGPRRRMAAGPIYLASRLQLPIVALGWGCDRPWRASSWDRFVVPRPFSRARAVTSREIYIPAGLQREELDLHRQQVERTLNELTAKAEAWAASRAEPAGSIAAKREGLPTDANVATRLRRAA